MLLPQLPARVSTLMRQMGIALFGASLLYLFVYASMLLANAGNQHFLIDEADHQHTPLPNSIRAKPTQPHYLNDTSRVLNDVNNGDLCAAKEQLAIMQDHWCSTLLIQGEITDFSQCHSQVKPALLKVAERRFHQARSNTSLSQADLSCMLKAQPTRAFIIEPEVDIKAHFKTGSAELDEVSMQEVANLAAVLTSPEFSHIQHLTIVGHADKTGQSDPDARHQRNQELSIERALAVEEYLHNHPLLSQVDMRIVGKGDSEPLIDEDSTEAYRANRRVHIVLD